MANARINTFQNIPLLMNVSLRGANIAYHSQSLLMQRVYIPGSISFNNLAILFSCSGTTARTISLSFGFYSLTGSTLSLANSASVSSDATNAAFNWMTFATSAAQDITPGDWFLALLGSTSGTSAGMSIVIHSAFALVMNSSYAGPFFKGWMSASTNALPASIATSDLSKDNQGTAATGFHPYILISA